MAAPPDLINDPPSLICPLQRPNGRATQPDLFLFFHACFFCPPPPASSRLRAETHRGKSERKRERLFRSRCGANARLSLLLFESATSLTHSLSLSLSHKLALFDPFIPTFDKLRIHEIQTLRPTPFCSTFGDRIVRFQRTYFCHQ